MTENRLDLRIVHNKMLAYLICLFSMALIIMVSSSEHHACLDVEIISPYDDVEIEAGWLEASYILTLHRHSDCIRLSQGSEGVQILLILDGTEESKRSIADRDFFVSSLLLFLTPGPHVLTLSLSLNNQILSEASVSIVAHAHQRGGYVSSAPTSWDMLASGAGLCLESPYDGEPLPSSSLGISWEVAAPPGSRAAVALRLDGVLAFEDAYNCTPSCPWRFPRSALLPDRALAPGNHSLVLTLVVDTDVSGAPPGTRGGDGGRGRSVAMSVSASFHIPHSWDEFLWALAEPGPAGAGAAPRLWGIGPAAGALRLQPYARLVRPRDGDPAPAGGELAVEVEVLDWQLSEDSWLLVLCVCSKLHM